MEGTLKAPREVSGRRLSASRLEMRRDQFQSEPGRRDRLGPLIFKRRVRDWVSDTRMCREPGGPVARGGRSGPEYGPLSRWHLD